MDKIDHKTLITSIVFNRSKIFASLFTSLHPVRCKIKNIYPPPFFIIGSPRSGNTLLRAILNSHPALSIPPELHILPWLYKRYITYNFLPWKDLKSVIIGEFARQPSFKYWNIDITNVLSKLNSLPKEQRSLEAIMQEVYLHYRDVFHPHSTIWGDKTPNNTLHLNQINKIFPRAKYINIIRDGRDVVNSLLKAKIYTNIADSCDRWILSLQKSKVFKKKIPSSRFMEFHYENLVNHPKDETKKICHFLGLEFDEQMLHFYQNVDKMGDTIRPHHVNLQNPINRESIGKWQKEMKPEDQEMLQHKLRQQLAQYNYK